MNLHSLLITLLTRIRDSRLLWDVMGSIYNQRIYNAISELYDHILGEISSDGRRHILDAGSGRGYMSLMIAENNPQASVTGIDYSPMQVCRAEKLRRQRNISHCTFTRGNVMNLPFPDGIFDAAVSIGSIKHWPDGVRGLMEIARVLKPDGYLIISETDQAASDGALRAFIQRFSVWFIPDRLLFHGLRHVIFGQSFSETTLTATILAAGFHHVECQRVSTCPYVIVKARK